MLKLTRLGQMLLVLLFLLDLATGGYVLWETLGMREVVLTSNDPTLLGVPGSSEGMDAVTLARAAYYNTLTATGLLAALIINAATIGLVVGFCHRSETI